MVHVYLCKTILPNFKRNNPNFFFQLIENTRHFSNIEKLFEAFNKCVVGIHKLLKITQLCLHKAVGCLLKIHFSNITCRYFPLVQFFCSRIGVNSLTSHSFFFFIGNTCNSTDVAAPPLYPRPPPHIYTLLLYHLLPL